MTGNVRPPFSAAVLLFSRPPVVRLQAVDMIQLVEPTGEFTVKRTIATPAAAAPGGG